MRAIFFGTPNFALPTLRAIHECASIDIVGVLTQPDRPAGRGKKLHPTPIKQLALDFGYEVLAPEKLKDPDVMPWLQERNPDVIVVVAYGGFILKPVRELPKYGCVNLHPSLLPKYRGAAPMQWAIMNGDAVTGNSTMYLSAGWDDGDVIYQEEETIRPEDDYGTLSERLSESGAQLIVKTLIDVEAGTAPRTPQPDEGVVMAPMISNEDAQVKWGRPAQGIYNHIRGLSPVPSAYTMYQGARWKLFRSEVIAEPPNAAPGTIVSTDFNTVRIAAQDAIVEVLELQPSGKRRMTAADFLRGHPLEPGGRCD